MTLDRHAHAVAQTLAAERLEGWEPTDEHVAALNALIHDEVSFADYFAAFRGRHPPPQRPRRRPGLRRATPYLIPGTTLLRNHFGATSAEMLAELEFVATAGRMARLLCTPVDDTDEDALDIQSILVGE